eukprot:jgi/Mesvir1/6501/Mv16769-RA.1
MSLRMAQAQGMGHRQAGAVHKQAWWHFSLVPTSLWDQTESTPLTTWQLATVVTDRLTLSQRAIPTSDSCSRDPQPFTAVPMLLTPPLVTNELSLALVRKKARWDRLTIGG